MIKSRKELINAYLKFFKSKNHKEIPNVSLIPEHDPAVLFTTAGMHPLIPFLLGQKHPQGKRLVNVQKCIRTSDIDKVGDTTHHTFIEMLGNWSLGDYWKKESIKFSFEFLTKVLKIPANKITVTCFKGEGKIPKDEESAKIWKSLGIKKIKFLGKEDNFWGPIGKQGPCGPCTEIFVNGFEIWNNVFMEYSKDEQNTYKHLKQKNVDTGMGVERTIAVLNGLDDDYKTKIFLPIIKIIEKLSNKKYETNKKEMRIIADHVKAAVFILNEKIIPSNVEQGYVLRRLIRRAILNARALGINDLLDIIKVIINIYNDYNLKKNEQFILDEFKKEQEKFSQALARGMKEYEKIKKQVKGKKISGKDAFYLFQSHGLPLEIIIEVLKRDGYVVDKKAFALEMRKHQELSRQATQGKFVSGLIDKSNETTRLHTATHLLHAALRQILGKHVQQKGSNITAERLRFDFTHDKKMTEQEIKRVEQIVNEKIKASLPITRKKMSVEQAKKQGALAFFTYPGKVSVYSIGTFSKEICTGPHVKNTRELGHFKIIKEEAVGVGIRRIKAVLE